MLFASISSESRRARIPLATAVEMGSIRWSHCKRAANTVSQQFVRVFAQRCQKPVACIADTCRSADRHSVKPSGLLKNSIGLASAYESLVISIALPVFVLGPLAVAPATDPDTAKADPLRASFAELVTEMDTIPEETTETPAGPAAKK